MTDTISFVSDGVLDRRAVSTMGLHAKPGIETPIGYFGTGLKYALAILLREGLEVTIWCGLEPLRFSSQEIEFRGERVKVVTCNGEELAFTLALGKNWKLWQAYRELASNTKDEGGETAKGAIDPQEGKTVIQVVGRAFVECHAKRSEIFLEDEADVTVDAVAERRDRESKFLYYRNVRVWESAKPFLYTWNITAVLGLTEDRTLSNPYAIDSHIIAAVIESRDAEFIEKIMTAPEHRYENTLYYTYSTPDEAFIDILAEVATRRYADLTNSARALLKKHRKEKMLEFVPDDFELAMLRKAIGFANALGFDVDERDMRFIETLSDQPLRTVYAIAEDGKSYIARVSFEAGTRTLTHALIEEHVHNKTGFGDETRELQTWLFQKIISLGEKYVTREPL